MIYIELSVEPHYANTPPHIILRREFVRTADASAFLRLLNLQTDSGAWEDVLRATVNQWVDVEMEVLEVTAREYTKATLSIEGQEGTETQDKARRISHYNERYKDLNIHEINLVVDKMGHPAQIELYGRKLDGDPTWMLAHWTPNSELKITVATGDDD